MPLSKEQAGVVEEEESPRLISAREHGATGGHERFRAATQQCCLSSSSFKRYASTRLTGYTKLGDWDNYRRPGGKRSRSAKLEAGLTLSAFKSLAR